ncbi:MAG: ferredoxin reductase family protein [Desulfobaccales bacterium]
MPVNRAALSRIIIYLALILLPLTLATIHKLPPPDAFAYNLGRGFALTAFAIMVLQVVLAARIKWIERPFGLNLTFPFHRRMGIFAAALLLTHPLLMALGGGGWELLLRDNTWYIWVGRVALLLLLTNVVLSVFRIRLGLGFEKWRQGHVLSGPAVLLLGFVHSWSASIDFTLASMQILWVALLALAAAFLWHHRVYTPGLLRRHPYQVVEVRQETHNVWTLKFAPPPGQPRFDYLPGQFQFVTLLRGRGLPEEEHHFTISSSPTETGFHTSTIKASGDFTATIGQTRPGDAAVIQAPFGRFSYLFHPQDRDLVFIAGGIGITPFMSNLRHMRDVQADRRVLLLYANKSEDDIVFREELASLDAGSKPEFQVIHILSHGAEAWKGESGRLDRVKIKQLCGARLENARFFLCCPPPMTESLCQILRGLGVPDERISFEYFSL